MDMVETIKTAFGFHIEYVDKDNHILHDNRLTLADFGHAVRHARFDAFCQGLTVDYQPSANGARIEPQFQEADSASPNAMGFCVSIPLPGGREHQCEFDLKYFHSSVNRLRADLVRTEALKPEQEVFFRLKAFLDDDQPAQPGNKLAINLEPAMTGISIDAGCRRDYGPTEAWDDPNFSDLPMLMNLSVLEDAVEEAKANPELEIAGFLLGHVHRDNRNNEVFVAVTGLASAGSTTESSATSVTYTPGSFAQVKNMIKLRGAGESVVGWYHSHPFKLCAECPLPTPPECIAKVLFYSVDDIHLMETTFDQPFMVGLLAAVEPRIEDAIGHLPVKVYGWSNGVIQERGFEVIGTAD